MPTKKELEAQLKEQAEELAAQKAHMDELVKRDKEAAGRRKDQGDTSGSHGIDHLTVLDNHETPDTNREPAEDIAQRMKNDLSFWGDSWCWNKSDRAYGNKPEDSWFINPTPKLVGEVMAMAPIVHGQCEVMLLDKHKDELDVERQRHLEFLRVAQDNELVSECLDMLKAYQGRYFEAVQQYLGRVASYENQKNRQDASDTDVEKSEARKLESAAVCRRTVAKLVALCEAYHEVQSDERAYNLHYDFSAAPGTRDYNLYRWSVQQALNNIGRRLTRSVKDGKLDAKQYRIPIPWEGDTQKELKNKADNMISDFA
jgi:hypothetical protein